MRRALPVVHSLIASPCDVPWSTMQGDDRTRHCKACSRDVHNLSAMTQAEMESFLVNAVPDTSGHLPCISLFQRTDGTVLTADCPVGLRARRRRALLTSTLGVGAVALVAMTALATLWLDHTRSVQAETAPCPLSSVMNPTPEGPIVYPPPLPGSITGPSITDGPGGGGYQMAGGIMPMPDVKPPPPPEKTGQIKGKLMRPVHVPKPKAGTEKTR